MRASSTAWDAAASVARWAALGVAAAAFAAVAVFALGTLATRPLDGTEGLLLFDAARLRGHLPLYVDPVAGAWDYGPVPSRTYVLHLPLWAAVLSLLPAGGAAPIGRALTLGAWLGLLAGVAIGARRGNRVAAWGGALFVAGAYPLTLFAASCRHDAPALLAAGIALLRTVDRGRPGAREGALFMLAALIKPNIVGAAAGVFARALATDRRSALRAVAGASVVAAPVGVVLHAAGGGAWLTHLLASTQATPSLAQWEEQLASRLTFFALPLAASLAIAWRARATPQGALGVWALTASAAWTVVSLAKEGSASNYWMEPCLVALIVVARVPLPRLSGARAAAAGALAVAQALWVGVAALRSALEGLEAARRQAAVIANVRTTCGADADSVVLADEPGLEVMIDGRAVQMPFAMTRQVRAERFALATWQADVRDPAVRCVVMHDDLLERPLARVRPEADLFDPAMRATLRDRFTLVASTAGLWVYRAR